MKKGSVEVGDPDACKHQKTVQENCKKGTYWKDTRRSQRQWEARELGVGMLESKKVCARGVAPAESPEFKPQHHQNK
jgi:hypothetical protein